MRPKPLIPAFKSGPFVVMPPGRANLLGPPGWLLHITVHDIDQIAVPVRVHLSEMLRDDDGPMPPAGAAYADRQVGLSLAHIRRQQVVEQRDQTLVELLKTLGRLDVLAD